MMEKERLRTIRRKTALSILLIAAAGIATYSNTFKVPFIFDDYSNIVYNPVIKNLDNFTASWTGYEYNPRRFIGYLSFALNYWFGGLDVTGYHIVNLSIHVANAILVYFLVFLTFQTPYISSLRDLRYINPGPQSPDPDFIALFSALLFVTHPVQTQAVTYIVQRFTALASMFYLLSVVFYVKGRLSAAKPEVRKRFTIHDSRFTISIVWYLLSLVSAVLAMRTKEIAFTLPLVIAFYEFIFFKSEIKKRLIFLLPLLLTLTIIPSGIMGTDKPLGEILSDLSEKTRVDTNITRWDYLITEMRVITTYVRLIFLPVHQNLDYDYPIYHSFFTRPVFLSFLFLSSLLGLAAYLFYKAKTKEAGDDRQETIGKSPAEKSLYSPIPSGLSPITLDYRLISFGILWFFITLSVESSFIPIADVIFEHRIYLPSVGAFIAVTSGIEVMGKRSTAALAHPGKIIVYTLALVVMGLSIATYARNGIWKDERTLWNDVVRKSFYKGRPHYNLGLVSHEQGRIVEAVREYRLALKLNSFDIEALNNLGNAYSDQGRIDEAIREYQTALKLRPDYSVIHYNMGNIYSGQGRIDEAIREYQTALKLNPLDAEAHNNLGGMYFRLGRVGEALMEIQTALKLNPDYADARKNLELVTKSNRP